VLTFRSANPVQLPPVMKFGAHVSIAGGIDKAPKRASDIGCECFQIFTRSPRGGKPPALGKDLVDSFLAECGEHDLTDYYVHTPYYINLASGKKDLRASSIEIIREELERSSTIGARYVMTHLGSSKGMDRKDAVKKVVDSLNRVLDGADELSSLLLLENTAGQGDTIGDTFEELASILDGIDRPDVGVCIDTAHLFASGYDIRTPSALKKTMDELSSVIDPGRIKLIHGNDSKIGLGEKKDRHEQIGKGKIGRDGFKAVISHPVLKKLNMIVEIPPDEVAADIALLKRLRKAS
jgi:deoxyribonuclease-4